MPQRASKAAESWDYQPTKQLSRMVITNTSTSFALFPCEKYATAY
jgi:hypothetical protein